MKRALISVFAALLCILPAMAETVSVSKASAAASAFFNGRAGTRSGARPTLVWTGSTSDTRSASDPAFYVFNFDGGGFVVIAGDDAAQPVLGYSETGSFRADNLPSNIRGWFDGYASQVEFVRKNHLTASTEIVEAWAEVMSGQVKDSGGKKELKTPTWGQDEPFYRTCPEIDGKKAVTGCVSTAIAEIMRYHKWPESATGKLPGYKYTSDLDNEITIPEHQLSGTYNWDLMPASYFIINGSTWYKNYTEEQASAVAAVMEDVGKMLQSNYNSVDSEMGTSGTGAFSEDIGPMLVKYMSYDSMAICRFRDEYKYKEWTVMMRAEIDAGRPVCYSGSGSSGGHQFILDGYSTNGMFYINWGWNGQDNGWFHLQVMDMGDSYDFGRSQNAVVGIKPASSDKGHPQVYLYYYMDADGNGGLKIDKGSFSNNSSVTVSATNLTNGNSGIIEGSSMGSAYVKYAIAVIGKDGSIKKTYAETEYKKLSSGYYYSKPQTFTFTVQQEVELGDRMMLCFKESSSSAWTPVKISEIYNNSFYKEKKYSIPDAIYAYDYPTIEVDPNGYTAGDVLDFNIINVTYVPFTVWYFDGEEVDNEIRGVKLESGKHTIKAVVELHKGTVNGSLVRKETLIREIVVN